MIFSLIQSCLIGSVPFSLSVNVNFNVACAGGAVAAAGGLWLILERQRERARADIAHRPHSDQKSDQKSNRFLNEMSDRLTLTEEEETLLITMTDELELTSPALLFVEPKHLQARCQDDSDDSECALMLLPKLYGNLVYVEAESKDE